MYVPVAMVVVFLLMIVLIVAIHNSNQTEAAQQWFEHSPPLSVATRLESLEKVFDRAGWTKLGEKAFKSNYPTFEIEMHVIELEPTSIHKMKCVLRPATPIPKEVSLHIPDARGFFHYQGPARRSFFPAHLSGTFDYKEVEWSGLLESVFLQCFELEHLEQITPPEDVNPSTFSIRNGEVIMDLVYRCEGADYVGMSGSTTVYDKPWYRSVDRFTRSMRALRTFGQGLCWSGQSPRQIMEGVFMRYGVLPEFKRQALAQMARVISPHEFEPMLVQFVGSTSLPDVDRGAALSQLSSDPRFEDAANAFLTQALSQPHSGLLRLFIDHASEGLRHQLFSPRRAEILNAVFAEDGGMSRELISDLVDRVPVEELLEPALSPRAREVLMFTIQDRLGDQARGKLPLAARSGGEITRVTNAGSPEERDEI